jgi:hypothetical protein
LRRLQSAVSPFGSFRAAAPRAPDGKGALALLATAAVARRAADHPGGGGGGAAGAEPLTPRTPLAQQADEPDDAHAAAGVAGTRSAVEQWDFTLRPEIDKRYGRLTRFARARSSPVLALLLSLKHRLPSPCLAHVFLNHPSVLPPASRFSDLVADVTLDERHERRRVKCVTWQPRPKYATATRANNHHHGSRDERRAAETFALKIAMRGPQDKHCKRLFTEKDAMLALAPSPWHATLVVRTRCRASVFSCWSVHC